jgi:hypothetical protein
MPDWLREAVQEGAANKAAMTWQEHLAMLVGRLLLACVLGYVAAGIYRLTMRHRPREESGSFLATLVLLSVLIAMVTLVIGNSVAKAFSLVGALAIVRFRTVVEDTRDTAFVIFAVVVGMAAGAGYLLVPLVGTPLVLLAAWAFAPRRAQLATPEGTLVLRLGVARPPDTLLREVLGRHLSAYRLSGAGTARAGAALDLTFIVAMPAAETALALVAELNRIEGVQSVELKER